MVSKFYEPVIQVLRANAPKALKVSEILHQVVAENPGLGWGVEAGGAVRAMLLRAAEAGGYGIKMTPDSQPPTFTYDSGNAKVSLQVMAKKTDKAVSVTGFVSKSILYVPALECLKAAKAKSISTSKVLHYINEKFPNLQWSHSQGPVRAMLLNTAGKPGSGISQVPEKVPPEFFYDATLAAMKPEGVTSVDPIEPSPEEQMQAAFEELQGDLRAQLLVAVHKMDETEFEWFTNELMSRLGYGQAKTTPKSRDKGIDGKIYADRLGLRVIRIQSKHYAAGHRVSAPEIRAFIGALQGDDGVFVTTSTYTRDAKDAAKPVRTNSKIVLIDGAQLVELMIENNFGVQATGTVYSLKKLDADFFADYGVELKT